MHTKNGDGGYYLESNGERQVVKMREMVLLTRAKGRGATGRGWRTLRIDLSVTPGNSNSDPLLPSGIFSGKHTVQWL